MEVYNKEKARFEEIWRQIAEEFKDYDHHLLFEGYNEMLDSYGSWCFASFATSSGYNASVASSAYQAINSYAQSFVNAVRSTGGNNAQRNLIVNTYGACCGSGTWNSHLTDPLTQMVLPTDDASNHLLFEVHSYLDVKNLNTAKSDFNQMLKRLSGTRRDVLGGDSVVRRIVFDTGSLSEEGLRVDSYDSPYPIYLRFDAGTGVATVSTRAGRISTGAISAYTFSALYALEEIENLRALCTEEAVTMNEMFAYAGLYADSSRFDVSGFRTPKVTTMYRMFYHCESLTELDLSGFDTSNVKDMDNMFSYCFKLKGLNLSSFNTSQVGVLRSMFNRCASIEELNLDHFDLSAATLASYMFYKMENLRRLSITGFNIGRSGLNINYMFSHCPNLEELRLGGDFVMSGGVPTAFFTSSADKKGVRTSSLAPEGLVIHCPENVADWLATTTLRWVYSGYSGSGRVNVRFFDSDKEYFPTWAAN